MYVVFEYAEGELGVVPKRFADYLINEHIDDEDVDVAKKRLELLKKEFETPEDAEKFVVNSSKYLVVVNTVNLAGYVIESNEKDIAYRHCSIYRGFNSKSKAERCLKFKQFK